MRELRVIVMIAIGYSCNNPKKIDYCIVPSLANLIFPLSNFCFTLLIKHKNCNKQCDQRQY